MDDHFLTAGKLDSTLGTSRRSYGLAARVLFHALDTVYGRDRTLGKFKVLELVARVPYQSWEQVAYVAITHVHEKTVMARRIYQWVAESRAQQDNEQWHLLILQEMIGNTGIVTGKLSNSTGCHRRSHSHTVSCPGSCSYSGRTGLTCSTRASKTTLNMSTWSLWPSIRSGSTPRSSMSSLTTTDTSTH